MTERRYHFWWSDSYEFIYSRLPIERDPERIALLDDGTKRSYHICAEEGSDWKPSRPDAILLGAGRIYSIAGIKFIEDGELNSKEPKR